MPGEKGTEEGCEFLQRTEWRNLCASILRISQGHQTNPGSLLAREHGGSPGYAHGGSPSSCPQDGRLGRGRGAGRLGTLQGGELLIDTGM